MSDGEATEDAYEAAATHLRDACYFHTQRTRNIADDGSFWEKMASIPDQHQQLDREDASSPPPVRALLLPAPRLTLSEPTTR